MKSDNNRSHVNNPSILVYAHWDFSIHTSLTLNFKWLVQINSSFTLGDLSARLSQRIQKALTGSYNNCQIIIGISWFIVTWEKSFVQCNSMQVLGSQWYWYTDSHSMGLGVGSTHRRKKCVRSWHKTTFLISANWIWGFPRVP